uniref:hypothetical protein n=1 Tax=Stappia sp. TaxID=1870903 RepID=UPI003BAC0FAE
MSRLLREMRRAACVAAVLAMLPLGGQGVARDLEANDFHDWGNAQLIFVQGAEPLDRALVQATKSPYTHVGIVRLTGGGPVVLETTPSLWEVFVEDFLDQSADGHYAVYGLRGLSEEDAFTPPRVANDFLEAPDDPYLREGLSEMSGAELVNRSYRSLGLDLGEPVPLGDLAAGSPELRTWLESVWRAHPDCSGQRLDRADCLARLERQKVLTPAAIGAAPGLVCLWSSFPQDRERCPGPR